MDGKVYYLPNNPPLFNIPELAHRVEAEPNGKSEGACRQTDAETREIVRQLNSTAVILLMVETHAHMEALQDEE